jgi:hypothetical protein
MDQMPLICLAWKPECQTRICDYPNAKSLDCAIKARIDMPIFVHPYDHEDSKMVCALSEGKVYGESEATKDLCNLDVMNSVLVSTTLVCPIGQLPILTPDSGIQCVERPKVEVSIEKASSEM